MPEIAAYGAFNYDVAAPIDWRQSNLNSVLVRAAREAAVSFETAEESTLAASRRVANERIRR